MALHHKSKLHQLKTPTPKTQTTINEQEWEKKVENKPGKKIKRPQLQLSLVSLSTLTKLSPNSVCVHVLYTVCIVYIMDIVSDVAFAVIIAPSIMLTYQCFLMGMYYLDIALM